MVSTLIIYILQMLGLQWVKHFVTAAEEAKGCRKATDILSICTLTLSVPISTVTAAEFQQSIHNREMAPDPHTLTQYT
jgi:hypothetical protein